MFKQVNVRIMSLKQKGPIILLALFIGVLMVTFFLGGQHLYARNHPLIGTTLTVLSFLVWPLYALFATLGIHFLVRRSQRLKQVHDRRQTWRRSIYWVPIGAVLAIQAMDRLFS
ncbi:MAG: hypothetical protein EA374_04500 [Acholeplasmatales bacterium]|nr:MAG: hypothetical protein EA374_04500 [Acholeplasmatales bacterium]